VNVFERSWKVAKASLDVVRQDPELIAFPLLSGALSLLFSLMMLVPTLFAGWLDHGGGESIGFFGMVAAFASYFGVAFFATFSNVCVIYTTRKRLSGGDATFSESIAFAMSRLPQIAGWSALSATVGLLLRALDQAARNNRGAGAIISGIMHSVIGMAWTVLTLFVVPAMVYDNIGPIDAISRSIEVLKRTWGESLIRHYGIGLLTFLAVIPGVLLLFLAASAASMSGALAIVIAIAAVCWILVVVFMSSLLNAVFNTALFHFATQNGAAPAGFDPGMLRGAFGQRGQRGQRSWGA
jgi:hypothetical protein